MASVLAWWISVRETRVFRKTSNFLLLVSIMASSLHMAPITRSKSVTITRIVGSHLTIHNWQLNSIEQQILSYFEHQLSLIWVWLLTSFGLMTRFIAHFDTRVTTRVHDYTHTLVSIVTSSLTLFGTGFQRRTFPFL
jgi:hypothetical protein